MGFNVHLVQFSLILSKIVKLSAKKTPLLIGWDNHHDHLQTLLPSGGQIHGILNPIFSELKKPFRRAAKCLQISTASPVA